MPTGAISRIIIFDRLCALDFHLVKDPWGYRLMGEKGFYRCVNGAVPVKFDCCEEWDG